MNLPALAGRLRARPGRARPPASAEGVLTQGNCYVLPTRSGLLFGLVLFVMLAACINDAIAMGYMLTFLLAAVGLVSMVHTVRNLVGLHLRIGRLEPVFAGQTARIPVQISATQGPERFALQVRLEGHAQEAGLDLQRQASGRVELAFEPDRRGRVMLPRVRLWTDFPLGLWRSWSWWRPATEVLVYPFPEADAPPLPVTGRPDGDGDLDGPGEADLAGIGVWRPGDSLRRVAWKAVARSGGDALLSKQFEGSDPGSVVLDWARLDPSLAPEARVSRLTRWVLDADASGQSWSLRLPDRQIDAGQGASHRARCLEALATCRV